MKKEIIITFDKIDPVLLKKFKSYHFKNPSIYIKFKELCLQMLTSGKSKYSAWTIINIIRWDHDLNSDDLFKINNDYIAIYARLFMHHHPEHKGFFQLRTMKPEGRKMSGEEYKRSV